jgi:hypothetical protein
VPSDPAGASLRRHTDQRPGAISLAAGRSDPCDPVSRSLVADCKVITISGHTMNYSKVMVFLLLPLNGSPVLSEPAPEIWTGG